MLKCREFNYFVKLKNKPLCRKINVHTLQKVWTFLEIRAWTFSFPKFSDFFRVCLFVDAKRQWIYLAATVLSYTMEVTSQCMGQSPFTLFLAVRSIGREPMTGNGYLHFIRWLSTDFASLSYFNHHFLFLSICTQYFTWNNFATDISSLGQQALL